MTNNGQHNATGSDYASDGLVSGDDEKLNWLSLESVEFTSEKL